MGGKRARKRKHLFLYLACFMMFMGPVAGCGKGGITLRKTEKPLTSGNNTVLEDFRKSPLTRDDAFGKSLDNMGEDALYRRGLFLAYPLNPGLDYEKSMACFKRLVRKFPESPLRQASEIWAMTLENVIRKELLIDALTQKVLSQEAEMLNHRKMNGRLKTRIKGLKSEIRTSQRQIAELKKQIETLKIIDLGIEKKKRKKTP